MKRILTLLALVNVIGCSTVENTPEKRTSQKVARTHVIGTWYSEKQLANGTLQEQTLENFDDGTYRRTVKTTFDGGYTSNNLELGQWGLSGDIYFTIARGTVEGCSIQSTDRQSSETYDAYQVDALSGDQIVYHHMTKNSSKTHRLQRVDDDFYLTQENPALDGCAYISKSSSKRPSKV